MKNGAPFIIVSNFQMWSFKLATKISQIVSLQVCINSFYLPTLSWSSETTENLLN
jgi:hypothetical protein